MKLSCSVTRDLLPLYHDGICSDESRALVEAHLEGCEGCRALLKELRGELEVPHEEPDDLGTMKKLENQVSQGRKRAWIKGAAAVLALVLVLGSVLAGLKGYENRRYQEEFARFAEGCEPVETEDEMYQGYYEWVSGNYLFRVAVPNPGYRGNVEVQKFKQTKDLRNPADLVQVSLSVQRYSGEADYRYLITVEDWENPTGAPQMVILDQNGQTVYGEGWDAETMARKNALVETYRTEILDIITAAEREWPFLLED